MIRSAGTGVTALTNGNYVVRTRELGQRRRWSNAGAVTWGSGTTGVVGAVSAANSLVGTTASDAVGTVTALTNGNYVVTSPLWDNGAVAGCWGGHLGQRHDRGGRRGVRREQPGGHGGK